MIGFPMAADFIKVAYFQYGTADEGYREVTETDHYDFVIISCGMVSMTFRYEDYGSYETVMMAVENVRDLMLEAYKIGVNTFEPLGEEFEEVWDNNIATLYES